MHDAEYGNLDRPTLGTTFEINDHRAVVVGIAHVPISDLFGIPTLYTTYRRAIEYIPSMRYTLSYILVQPKTAESITDAQSSLRASEDALQSRQCQAAQEGLRLTEVNYRAGLVDYGSTGAHHEEVRPCSGSEMVPRGFEPLLPT